MKKKADVYIFTAQGRLSLDEKQAAALDECAEVFAKAQRHLLAAMRHGERVNKTDFSKMFGIHGRLFNSIEKTVKGMTESQQSNLKHYISKENNRQEKQSKRLKKNKSKLETFAKMPSSIENKDIIDELWRRRRAMQDSLNRSRSAKNAYLLQLEEKMPRICLGSRKLFNAQHHLAENGYECHEEWKADWQASRQRHIFLVGSKDETNGCSLCQTIEQPDGTFTFKIRLPHALQDRHGKDLYLTDVTIGRGADLLSVAAAENRERKSREPAARTESARIDQANKTLDKLGIPYAKAPTLNKLLEDHGQAMSYRLVKDKKGWRILISVEHKTLPAIITDRTKGAIGVDFNADHLAVTDVDHQGNKVKTWTIPLPRGHAVTSHQNAMEIQLACKEVIAYALQVGKPVYIEDLDFTLKKSKIKKKENTGYNQMLSVLSYRLFETAMTRRGRRFGIDVSKVNPAYTSFLGRLKYLNQTNGNVHQAAAMVIARKGKGHQEGMPKISPQKFRQGWDVFCVPEDMQNGDRTTLYKLRDTLNQWISDKIDALRRQQQEHLERRLQQCLVNEFDAALDALQ